VLDDPLDDLWLATMTQAPLFFRDEVLGAIVVFDAADDYATAREIGDAIEALEKLRDDLAHRIKPRGDSEARALRRWFGLPRTAARRIVVAAGPVEADRQRVRRVLAALHAGRIDVSAVTVAAVAPAVAVLAERFLAAWRRAAVEAARACHVG
jgi:hypothetical protein